MIENPKVAKYVAISEIVYGQGGRIVAICITEAGAQKLAAEMNVLAMAVDGNMEKADHWQKMVGDYGKELFIANNSNSEYEKIIHDQATEIEHLKAEVARLDTENTETLQHLLAAEIKLDIVYSFSLLEFPEDDIKGKNLRDLVIGTTDDADDADDGDSQLRYTVIPVDGFYHIKDNQTNSFYAGGGVWNNRMSSETGYTKEFAEFKAAKFNDGLTKSKEV